MFCCLQAAFRTPLEPWFKSHRFLVKGSELFPQMDQTVHLAVAHDIRRTLHCHDNFVVWVRHAQMLTEAQLR